MADLFSLERIAAQNGWSMAGLGIIIDLTGLAALSLIISQVPKLVNLLEKIKTLAGGGSSPEKPSVATAAPAAPEEPVGDFSSTDISDLANFYQNHTRELGDTFLLVALYRLAAQKALPHPHLTIKSLRETGLLLPKGDGYFAWNM